MKAKKEKKHFKSVGGIIGFIIGIMIILGGVSLLGYVIASTPFNFEFDYENQSFLYELFAGWGWVLVPVIYIVSYLVGPFIAYFGYCFVDDNKPRTNTEWIKKENDRKESEEKKQRDKEDLDKKKSNPHRCETCYYYKQKGIFGHYCEYMSDGYHDYSVDDDGKIHSDYTYTSKPNVSSYGTCSHWTSKSPYDRNDYHE